MKRIEGVQAVKIAYSDKETKDLEKQGWRLVFQQTCHRDGGRVDQFYLVRYDRTVTTVFEQPMPNNSRQTKITVWAHEASKLIEQGWILAKIDNVQVWAPARQNWDEFTLVSNESTKPEPVASNVNLTDLVNQAKELVFAEIGRRMKEIMTIAKEESVFVPRQDQTWIALWDNYTRNKVRDYFRRKNNAAKSTGPEYYQTEKGFEVTLDDGKRIKINEKTNKDLLVAVAETLDLSTDPNETKKVLIDKIVGHLSK